jgi:hypothetical protein
MGMFFNKNQLEFKSQMHQNIWRSGVLVLPLEITLPERVRSVLNVDLVSSCEQMQMFLLDLLHDMYIHAETDRPNPKQYLRFFIDFSLMGEVIDKSLVIHYISWDKYINKASRSKFFSDDYKFGIDFNRRLKSFERVGLKIEQESNQVILFNSKYPDMFNAMKKMADISLKEKVSADNSFTYCDFRKLCKDYKTDYYKNALSFLNYESLRIAELFEEYAKEFSLVRTACKGYCKEYCFDYNYKKHNLLRAFCGFSSYGSDTTNILLHFSSPYVIGKPETMEDTYFKLMENESDEFKKYFLKNMKRCTHCNPKCLGQPIRIFGKLNRVCNCHGVKIIKRLTLEDMPYIKNMIQIRVLAINSVNI